MMANVDLEVAHGGLKVANGGLIVPNVRRVTIGHVILEASPKGTIDSGAHRQLFEDGTSLPAYQLTSLLARPPSITRAPWEWCWCVWWAGR